MKNSKGLVGFNYLFEEISQNKIPFDEETFCKSEKRFVIGATNCNTGKTEYFEKHEADIYTILQASASMPLVSRMVNIKGKPFLDGAIDCNIPIEWAIEEGYEKIIVVLTRNKEYRKETMSSKMKQLYRFSYKQYPKLVQSIYDRPNKYNDLYKRIEQLENDNKIMVFQPKDEVNISRLEKDQYKLRELYKQGIDDAQRRLEELKKYLER